MKPHEVRNMAKGIIGKSNQQDNDEDPGDDSFESMHIEKADNGYTVNTRHKQKPSKGDRPAPYDEGKKHVFTHQDDVAEHVRNVLSKK